MAGNPPTILTLKEILAAFNAHDLDDVMQFFSEDRVLEMPRGPIRGVPALSVSRR
jgi:ketosteroid isomerase-like protein